MYVMKCICTEKVTIFIINDSQQSRGILHFYIKHGFQISHLALRQVLLNVKLEKADIRRFENV